MIPSAAPSANDLTEAISADIPNSEYFKQVPVYELKNTSTRAILPQFNTRRQRTPYSCGPVAAMMVTDYYTGKCPYEEIETAKIMNTSTISGTDVKGMSAFFDKIGWDVTNSLSKPAPKTYENFIKWTEKYLRAKTPIIVENVEWGGHWRVIIGYDNMGTDNSHDDILIMADPYDIADHHSDGYNIVNARKFYYMWFDTQLFPKEQQQRPYVIAKPK